MAITRRKSFISRRRRIISRDDQNALKNRRMIINLFLFPLIILDVCVSSLLWLHTMIFQLSLYAVYFVLFILCHATGNTHKLERSERRTLKTELITLETDAVKEVESLCLENESGYFTDTEEEENRNKLLDAVYLEKSI